MKKTSISSWIRQARHRAKSYNIYSELNSQDIEEIIQHYETCAYCEKPTETLDHAFPLKDQAPNVAANVLPCCKSCKSIKKYNDLVWMYNNGHISEEIYTAIMEDMITRPGSEKLKEHIKIALGISDE